MPPELAGRENVKAEFISQLNRREVGKADPQSILLIGPRGCGKTTLLRWLDEKATKSGVFNVARIPVKNLFRPDRLASVLTNFLPARGRGTAAFEVGINAPPLLGGGKFRSEGHQENSTLDADMVLRELASDKPLL